MDGIFGLRSCLQCLGILILALLSGGLSNHCVNEKTFDMLL
jgi:hypothetical protein